MTTASCIDRCVELVCDLEWKGWGHYEAVEYAAKYWGEDEAAIEWAYDGGM